jgi:hypothetical protein
MEKNMSEKNTPNDVIERVNKANIYLNEEHNLAGQLNWYDNKAVFNKTWHMRLGLIIIIAGTVTSIVQLWSPSPEGVHWSTWLSAVLGAVVVIAKGIDSLWKFDENWSNYRQAAEQIKRERRLFINSVGPYQSCSNKEIAFQLFTKRIEQIIATEENIFWKDKVPTNEEPNKKQD